MSNQYLPVASREKEGARPCGNFTMVELLVVIAIIALLSSMLFPILAKSRDKAKSMQCVFQLKSIGTAVQLYADDWRGYCPPANADCDWTVKISSYLSEPAPIDWLHRRENSVFRCPMTRFFPGGKPWVYNAYTIATPSGQCVDTPAFTSAWRSDGLYMVVPPRMARWRDTTALITVMDGLLNANYRPSPGITPTNLMGVGGKIDPRHNQGANYLFGDFHAENVVGDSQRFTADWRLSSAGGYRVDRSYLPY